MRRHPALHPYSDEHHRALVQARHLRRVGTDTAILSPLETAAGFLDFWDTGGHQHFCKEEQVLLPLYDVYGDVNAPEVVQMLLEHIRIRRLVQQLRKATNGNSDSVGGIDLPPDVLTAMQELGALFDAHIRHEERVVFPLIEQAVPDAALRSIGEFPLC